MNSTLTAAIAESKQSNRTVPVEVADIEAAYLDLLASDYEIDSEGTADLDGAGVPRVSRLVWGWTGDGNAHDEAEWSVRLVRV